MEGHGGGGRPPSLPPPFPGSNRTSLPASLQSTRLVVKPLPILPLEIVATILDYAPVSTLMRCARASKKLKEIAYDDSRWVNKLVAMGVWNEGEARKRFEDALKKKRMTQARLAEEERRRRAGSPGRGEPPNRISMGATLFDVDEQQSKANGEIDTAGKLAQEVDLMALSPKPPVAKQEQQLLGVDTADSTLTVLSDVRSARGFARQEYGRVYGALWQYYIDLVSARSHTDPVLFRRYRNPEDQAVMLRQLKVFSESDSSLGWAERSDRLNSMTSIFENAVLREFEGGYEASDYDGRMKRYANVLILLNGGQGAIDLFVAKHYLMFERERLGNPMDCFNNLHSADMTLEPARDFFKKLSTAVNEQSEIIDRIFPASVDVMKPFLERIGEDVIGEYVTPLLEELHDRDIESYLLSVTEIYVSVLHFSKSIKPAKGSQATFANDMTKMVIRIFEPHYDLYLQEELDHFKRLCEQEVESWEKKITDEYTATESFYMSNVNRQADKVDFLASFKKVILTPVNAITLPPMKPINITFPFAKPKVQPTPAITDTPAENPFPVPSETPDEHTNGDAVTPNGSATLSPQPAPTSELAAKAAILNSRMEGIRTLFSIELALDLVHKAKAALERAACFVRFGGQIGEEAKEQCEQIFISLIQTLGQRHVRSGFDKAVNHLSQYNPRELSTADEDDQVIVKPLVQFMELVNVGDLIQQMLDVFYEQELVAHRLSDRHDFLNPALKEKKRFEQMLDERVAAGLNTGIDVLIKEVDYVFAKTQKPTDYNPGITGDCLTPDIGPSEAARKVIDLVGSHTKLLVGSTDKNVLDVFNQEVGMRLWTSICKHLKIQRISIDGAIVLISDVNHYTQFIVKLRNSGLTQYYNALRELAQIYLIDPQHAKQMAAVIADGTRFKGIFTVEEVYEFVTRRSDWYQIKKDVEGAMYGFGCSVMSKDIDLIILDAALRLPEVRDGFFGGDAETTVGLGSKTEAVGLAYDTSTWQIMDFPIAESSSAPSNANTHQLSRIQSHESPQILDRRLHRMLSSGERILEACDSQLQTMSEKGLLSKDNLGIRDIIRRARDIGSSNLNGKTVVAFIGDSGVGKSTLLNALLDSEEMIPTSGVRAFIQYLDQEEFQRQAEILCYDIGENDQTTQTVLCANWQRFSLVGSSSALKRVHQTIKARCGAESTTSPESTAAAIAAKDKLKALFPTFKTYDIAAVRARIRQLYQQNQFLLAGTQFIESNDEAEFAEQLRNLIANRAAGEEEENDSDIQLWPLIKVIRVQLDADVLNSDIVLVDLPGLRDHNTARAAAAEDYLAKADEIVIVSRLARVFTDETTTSLAKLGYARQLQAGVQPWKTIEWTQLPQLRKYLMQLPTARKIRDVDCFIQTIRKAFTANRLLVADQDPSFTGAERKTRASQVREAKVGFKNCISGIQANYSHNIRTITDVLAKHAEKLAAESIQHCLDVQQSARLANYAVEEHSITNVSQKLIERSADEQEIASAVDYEFKKEKAKLKAILDKFEVPMNDLAREAKSLAQQARV
ncbi:Recyclin-1 [Drechslerella dactyloides]|uniref:Recyclin-1 n=1 Tax=Drechslerella dactyloides TaxID=74499 RepID=A0AAD6NIU0_DREDA|nr:Recyclin-1 [Drechslerella dactyloides]